MAQFKLNERIVELLTKNCQNGKIQKKEVILVLGRRFRIDKKDVELILKDLEAEGCIYMDGREIILEDG